MMTEPLRKASQAEDPIPKEAQGRTMESPKMLDRSNDLNIALKSKATTCCLRKSSGGEDFSSDVLVIAKLL